MKSKSVFDSENFLTEFVNEISIVTIKVPRVTFIEAEEFKQILQSVVLTHHKIGRALILAAASMLIQ